MKLYISENLKRLRKKRGLTQEQLAERLSVSFQAVSKWECGEGYPDIVMLPSIAQIFGVSLDELVGMEKICSNEEAEKILAQVDMNESKGLRSENVVLLREAVKRFPNNYMMLAKLASNLFCAESKGEEAGYEKSAEAAEIAEYILANCNDRKITDWMRMDICYYYYYANKKEKALERAEELPAAARNTVKEFLLEGNEKMIRCQENIILHLQELCYSLLARADVNCNDDPQLKNEDRIKILNKIVDISKVIFENRDYNFHYGLMVVVYTHIAAVEVRSKDYDKAFDDLQKALDLAFAADELPERNPYTSLAVNKLIYDIYDISCSTPTLCCKELLKYLKWSVFDDIRDTENFQNIYLNAKEHCNK